MDARQQAHPRSPARSSARTCCTRSRAERTSRRTCSSTCSGSTAHRTTLRRFELGIEAVKETLDANYFRHDEANKAQSLVEQKGRHRFIDRVEVRFFAERDEVLGRDGQLRLLRGSTWRRSSIAVSTGCSRAGSGPSSMSSSGPTRTGPRASPFHIADLQADSARPFRLRRVLRRPEGSSRTDEWIDVLVRSSGLEPDGSSSG